MFIYGLKLPHLLHPHPVPEGLLHGAVFQRICGKGIGIQLDKHAAGGKLLCPVGVGESQELRCGYAREKALAKPHPPAGHEPHAGDEGFAAGIVGDVDLFYRLKLVVVGADVCIAFLPNLVMGDMRSGLEVLVLLVAAVGDGEVGVIEQLVQNGNLGYLLGRNHPANFRRSFLPPSP